MIGAWFKRANAFARNKWFVNAAIAAGIALVSAVVAMFAVAQLSFLTSADRFVRDWQIALRAPIEPQDPNIRIVAVDEAAMKHFAYRSPLDREFIAKMLLALDAKHPRVIVLDYLLDQPTEWDKDELLAKVIRNLKTPLVVSYFDTDKQTDQVKVGYYKKYVPRKSWAAANYGTDQTDTVRFIVPYIDTLGTRLPTVPVRVAQIVGAKVPDKQIDIVWRGDPGQNQPAFGEYPACVSGWEGCLPLEFYPEPIFKDKIVLIGSRQALVDQHRTPFAAWPASGKGVMSGIVTIAYAIAQLVEDRHEQDVPWHVDFLIALFLAAMGAWLGLFDYYLTLRTIAIVALTLALWFGVGVYVYERLGFQIGLIAPTIALFGAFAAVESVTGLDARRQRQFIHNTFSLYLPPSFVQQIVDDPDKLVLGGERRDLSLLFTDIHGFTTMAEGLDSKDVGRVLNAYLDGMTAAVRKHEGTIDKFIGDAVFALWNAPLDVPDYATKAVRCALDMDIFTEEFRKRMNAEGIPLSYTRIGVHAGAAAVGNFGSADRFSYTASGDAVNAASRLEGLNKTFGTRLCVSGAAKVLCTGIAFRPIGSVVLKGKTEALDVWEPLHDGAYSADYLARYDAAFEAARMESSAAEAMFAALAAERPDDPLARFYVERFGAGETGIRIMMHEK